MEAHKRSLEVALQKIASYNCKELHFGNVYLNCFFICLNSKDTNEACNSIRHIRSHVLS